ncbi:MAG TPA: glycerate kinase [Casimicrobiaceae bacterium]
MNIVLAPDSFKGSLTAPQACAAMEIGLRRVWPGAGIRPRPMADGGEGTLDAILHAVGAGAQRESMIVPGASGVPVEAAYGVIDEGGERVGVIEIAQIVSITDPIAMQADAGLRSSIGVGVTIRALLDRGVRDFRVALGGSSTSDGGAGLLVGLGVRLLDHRGNAIDPVPRALARIARVDASTVDARLRDSRIAILSDVNNPLCGAMGAIAVFGPQKGVASSDVAPFDAALAHYAALAERAFGRAVADMPGAGSAGGLGFALQLVGGTLASGAAIVADVIKLDAALAGADWAITGEGRSDAQTLLAKAPFVVAQRARRHGVPVSLVSGAVHADSLAELSRVFAGCFGLPNGPMTLQECVENAAALLADRAEQIARVRSAAQG